MKNLKPIVGLLVFLSGCATTANYEKILNSWIGSNVDDLVMRWGRTS